MKRPSMPYEINIEGNGTKIITRYYGVLTISDIFAALEERFSDVERTRKCRIFLSDFTDVTETRLGDLDVRSLTVNYKEASSDNPDVIAVAVVPRDLLYGLGRMWEVYVESTDIPWKVEIVRTREEAQALIDEYNANR